MDVTHDDENKVLKRQTVKGLCYYSVLVRALFTVQMSGEGFEQGLC